jgi:flavin reductase (DIM6/NTAB) family NADH-FMN oxidoreductase RutF
MNLDPDALQITERYKLLIGAIVPRPIAWVSSLSKGGKPNLAPFSFFNGVGSDPMTLLFCPANDAEGSEKDTLRNVDPETGTGEFTVNVVTERQAQAMAITAEGLPAGESEWELAGLESEASAVVKPARVKGAPVAFECRTDRIVRLNPGAAAGGNVVIGRVVSVYAHDDVIDERMRIDPGKLAAVGRMAGLGYCTTRERFDIPWGKDAVGAPDPIPVKETK